MTLIEARDGDGLIGRCDEKCYGAETSGQCACICQGANHGLGLERAIRQTRDRLDEWRAAEIRRRGTNDLRFLSVPLNQFDLFPPDD